MFHLPNNAGTRDYELSSKIKAHMLISKEIILIKMISCAAMLEGCLLNSELSWTKLSPTAMML